MFTINDGYINALQEAINPHNKFDDMREVSFNDVDFEDIPDLYNCRYCREFNDFVVCNNCNSVIHIDDIGKGDKEVDVLSWSQRPDAIEPAYDRVRVECEYCPKCEYGLEEDETFEYRPLEISDLLEVPSSVKGLDGYFGETFMKAVHDYVKEQDDAEIITEAKEEVDNVDNKQSEEPVEKSKPVVEKDDNNYTELKDSVKKEMYKYLKSNGIDVEHLIKAGVELDTMKPILDKVLDTYVSTDIANYENEFNVGLAWDYTVDNNDIVITIENM